MKNNKWLLVASLFCIGIFSAQTEKKIDTVTIKGNVALPNVSIRISKEDLQKSSGENLAKTLENISGVTMLQTGSTNAKPVIQGLSHQRISILNNGVKIESQQWGSDHSPEIDPFLAQNIRVIKGAEAVKYGANALGGIVLLSSGKLPYFGNKIGGKVQLIGESNAEKWAGNILLEGNLNQKNALAWRIQTSAKKAGDYKTAKYIVNNTGVEELNYSANLGYQMRKEKIEVFYSYFSTVLGVFKGSRIGSPMDWDLRLNLGRPIFYEPFRYEIQNPKQKVNHHLAKFSIESQRKFGKTNLVYAYQKNHRSEYDIRRGSFAEKPSLDVELRTHSVSLDFEKKLGQHFTSFLGGIFSHQKNYNIPGNGVNSILPNFISDNFGAYLSQEFHKNSWTLNAGLRFDYKDFISAGYDRIGKYYTGNKSYQNWSYSLGASKRFGNYFSVNSNIGMAWRAPEAIELFSNGVHHGSAFYLKGNPNLELEKGWKWSSRLDFRNEKWDVSLDFFLQRISGFIYEMPTQDYINTWSGYFPLFQYKQSDAFFRGADFSLKYHPISAVKYQLRASAVYADNLSEEYYFPHISPENLSQELWFGLDKLIPLKGSYLSLEHRWANKQKRFSAESDLLPDSPPAYHLLNASVGTKIKILKENDMSISLSINNLTNNFYKDYTDRLRYFVHALGRNFVFRIHYNF